MYILQYITAVHVINRTGATKNKSKTPYELWYGEKPTTDKFWNECFVHVLLIKSP